MGGAEIHELSIRGSLCGGSSMKLKGKGFYIWRIPNCDGGDPVSIAAAAKQAKLSHVLIKIADGPSWRYNYDETPNGVDLVPPLVAELRKVGIHVCGLWGWMVMSSTLKRNTKSRDERKRRLVLWRCCEQDCPIYRLR
jgi:hypothetical protein